MALTAKMTVGVTATQTATLDWGIASAPLTKAFSVSLASGTGAGQADRAFTDTRTLSASATEDLDLAGVLTDAFGATLTFAKVKGIYIAAASGNTNNVIVGNATTNGFISWVGGAAHTLTVRPGGVLALFCGAADTNGYAVTAGTADLLKIANSAGTTSVTYDIAIIGTSA
jgi:hypothetical protein